MEQKKSVIEMVHELRQQKVKTASGFKMTKNMKI